MFVKKILKIMASDIIVIGATLLTFFGKRQSKHFVPPSFGARVCSSTYCV
jgi:hypothetical protein